MNAHPLYNNAFDYRGFTSFPFTPTTNTSFLNAVRPKSGFLSKLTGGLSLSKVGTFIGNTQKVLNVYNQVSPIIKQTRPLINNLRTTFKVAKAFKKFSGDDSLEKAFDNLPDFEKEPANKAPIKEDIIDVKDETKRKEMKEPEFIDIVEVKDDKTIPNPFFVML